MKVLIYALGMKGYALIESLITSGLPIQLECCIGSDSDVVNDYSHEIESICKKNNIQCYFHNKNSQNIHFDFDIIFAAGWRKLIKLQNYSRLVVFHDSLLPAYRGFAPLVTSLLNKEKVVGVTALLANQRYDTGDIIAQLKCEIHYPTKIAYEIERVSSLYGDLGKKILHNLIFFNKELKGTSQDEAKASYSLWLDEDDYKIDWSKSSEQILHFINCVGYPYKGAKTFIEGASVRIFSAETEKDINIINRSPGKVIFMNGIFPIVVCGIGLLKITEIKNDLGESILPLKRFRTRFLEN